MPLPSLRPQPGKGQQSWAPTSGSSPGNGREYVAVSWLYLGVSGPKPPAPTRAPVIVPQCDHPHSHQRGYGRGEHGQMMGVPVSGDTEEHQQRDEPRTPQYEGLIFFGVEWRGEDAAASSANLQPPGLWRPAARATLSARQAVG